MTQTAQPLAVDLFSGLGGWADGLLAERWRVLGFDIERHHYGDQKYPGQLVLQDVLTLHGSQFRNADLIVSSPPCQEFSYMAMPWSLAKRKAHEYRTGVRDVTQLTALFDASFRIQREASEAAGRHIPMIVENVRGAQPWVGPATFNFGSFFFWGDIPALMPIARSAAGRKNNGGSWFAIGSPGQKVTGQNPDGRKVPGMNFHDFEKTGKPGRSFQSAAVADSFGWSKETPLRDCNSKGPRRKAASAQIAKIPFPLAQWIATVFKPAQERVA